MFNRNTPEDVATARQFSRRAVLIGGLQVAGFGALAARLYQLQIMEGSRYAPLADTNRLTTHQLVPIRGRIFDAVGRVLADNEENFRLIITPSLAGDVAAVLRRAGDIVAISPEDVANVLKRMRRQARKVPIVVRGGLSFEDVAKINVMAPHLPGIETDLIGRRRYEHGAVMSHLVGYTGAVERFALNDDPILRMPGMRVGKVGVEKGLESILRGRGGVITREVDARGRIVRDLARRDPERGQDVVLTVDTDLQTRILRRLSRVRRGAVVVLDINTGAIVAMASWPNADASVIGEGVSQSAWRKLASRRGDPLFNRAIQGQYPPGSTFKMVTALAALQNGDITARERVVCRGSYTLGGKRFRCWKRSGHGAMNLDSAMRQSCDVYFYEIARRVGIDRLAEMGREFGFGATFDETGIAAQKPGIMPDEAWKLRAKNEPWYTGETLLAGIGQGFVSATPLQLAVMTARLASGRKVIPQLARPVGDPLAGAEIYEPLPVEPTHLRAVQRAMVGVVHGRGGTGKNGAVNRPGVRVAGKTGTAQVTRLTSFRAQSRLPWRLRDHALFVSYAPAARPRFAVSVIVEHGMSGGKAAAPLASDIMEILLDYNHRPSGAFDIGDARSAKERS